MEDGALRRSVRMRSQRVEPSIVEIETNAQAQRRAAERRSRMQVRVIGLKDDHEAFDREYFAALSPDEKMAMVPMMFTEQWLLKGGDAGLLRLRRDIARLQRRGR